MLLCAELDIQLSILIVCDTNEQKRIRLQCRKMESLTNLELYPHLRERKRTKLEIWNVSLHIVLQKT